MRSIFNAKAPKRLLSVSLNEDLLDRARAVTNDLPDFVESLLSDYVALERARRAAHAAATTEAVEIWNTLDERHGSFADEHSTLQLAQFNLHRNRTQIAIWFSAWLSCNLRALTNTSLESCSPGEEAVGR